VPGNTQVMRDLSTATDGGQVGGEIATDQGPSGDRGAVFVGVNCEGQWITSALISGNF
jgi:hypothetical protein